MCAALNRAFSFSSKQADVPEHTTKLQRLSQIHIKQQNQSEALSEEVKRQFEEYNKMMFLLSKQFSQWDETLRQLEGAKQVKPVDLYLVVVSPPSPGSPPQPENPLHPAKRSREPEWVQVLTKFAVRDEEREKTYQEREERREAGDGERGPEGERAAGEGGKKGEREGGERGEEGERVERVG
ncbi:hypothetical protein JZ751_007378 [Albula glossodonta]|uniref:Uncharacterized protein n=1 Tax=Albula glossodonta TaxID=121402 RepID=A0A8T2N5H4_9TELE|nr:hypothetical protein JZ751_007378 [Albula glossodonta]